MGKVGRPRKTGGSEKDRKLREQWRKASKKYYRVNKKKVLGRAKRNKKNEKSQRRKK